MTAVHAKQLVDGYLGRLELELLDVPTPRRKEIVDEIRDHIAEEREGLEDESDADLMNLLDRLGDPAEIAAAARDGLSRTQPAQSVAQVGILEILALILTPIVWPVGVILLWASSAWTTRQKLLGTLIFPGGYPVLINALFLASVVPAHGSSQSDSCTRTTDASGGIHYFCGPGSSQIATAILVGLIAVALLLAPVVVGIYLATRLRVRPATA